MPIHLHIKEVKDMTVTDPASVMDALTELYRNYMSIKEHGAPVTGNVNADRGKDGDLSIGDGDS